MNGLLKMMAARLASPVEQRLFAEYGALFVTTATPPPTIIFADAAEVDAFQSQLTVGRARLGDYEMTLQTEALDALIRAASEMNDHEGQITARAADSGARSYQDTLNLWTRNVTRGLDHWEAEARITSARAAQIRQLAAVEQVSLILEIEAREQLFSMWLRGPAIDALTRYVRDDMASCSFEMWARAGREISAEYAKAGSPPHA